MGDTYRLRGSVTVEARGVDGQMTVADHEVDELLSHRGV